MKDLTMNIMVNIYKLIYIYFYIYIYMIIIILGPRDSEGIV